MSQLRDEADAGRLVQDFEGGQVWVDYARDGDTLSLLHVEADGALRGTGASGRFMQAVADHGRAEGLKFKPRCSYAVVWFQRHKDVQYLLA